MDGYMHEWTGRTFVSDRPCLKLTFTVLLAHVQILSLPHMTEAPTTVGT